ncbi:MAG: hypothetical protein IJX17_08000 [Clostridia bacterium]|nr:hypothetical protein [Clostridia bacterium]
MFENEQEVNFFGSNVVVETEKESKQTYNFSQSQVETKKDKEKETFDDYSAQQNFDEETNYESKPHSLNYVNTNEEQESDTFFLPLIEKKVKEEVKTVETPIVLNARMKLLLTSFIVIVSSLLFATVWNFVTISKLSASVANKSQVVQELQVSINDLSDEYNLLGDIEHLKELIDEAGYIESNDSNTITISLDDMYKEHNISEMPSNWFNDVCNFISSLFK